ncbi:hypothetical protein [Streptomyces sp. CAU 1734]|uniref:hypothetical protein n=1 Tax=Streptomyces sp. CAU 1734 TaxID=3140360 RepID=UPI0032603151
MTGRTGAGRHELRRDGDGDLTLRAEGPRGHSAREPLPGDARLVAAFEADSRESAMAEHHRRPGRRPCRPL